MPIAHQFLHQKMQKYCQHLCYSNFKIMNPYAYYLPHQWAKSAHDYAAHAGIRLTAKEEKACQTNVVWFLELCIKIAKNLASIHTES
jgi:hypothetical protein